MNASHNRSWFIAQVILPTFWTGLAIWGFGSDNLWLKILFGIVFVLSMGYAFFVRARALRERPPTDGNLDVAEDDTSQIFQLEITVPPEQLKDKDQVIFKVRKIPADLDIRG